MPQPTTFFLKQGNTLPVITATLTDQFGNAVNLTGASVHFHMTNFYFGNVVNSPATVVNATAGQVSYSWQTGDTSNTGLFSCEWYVVFSTGSQATYPYGYYNSVQIDPALNVGFPEILQPSAYFNTILSGPAAPTALNGSNGDFWYNTANQYFYGPKANGAWPAGYPTYGSGGSGAVTSVFTRTGDVVATTGDYTHTQVGSAQQLVPTSVKTTDYTGSPGDLAIFDTTSGACVFTLPTSPADRTVIGAKVVTLGAGNSVTIKSGGSDVFNKAGGATTLTLSELDQGTLLQYAATPAIWYGFGDDLPLSQTDARYLQTADSSTQTVTGPVAFSGEVTAQTPVNPTDVVILSYLQGLINGLQYKGSVTLTTTASLPTNIYNNGASGVGATITAVSTGVVTVDGTNLTTGMTVLVQNEATAANNGPYTVTTAGAVGVALVLTRTTNMNTASEFPGALIAVESGSVNAGLMFIISGAGPFTVGTTAVNWTKTGISSFSQLSGTASASQGGTGQTSLQASMNTLAGATTAGYLLRGNGTNVGMSPLLSGDIPNNAANTTGNAATATSFTGSLAGDVTGTQGATSVVQIQGVAVTAAEASLVASLNNAATRSSTATLLAGEETVFTGSTASQTLTLPVTPPTSSINTITNTATVSVTLAPGEGATLSTFGTTGNIVIPSGYMFSVVYTGTTWYVQTAVPSDFASGDALGIANGGTGAKTQQAALNAVAGATTAGYFPRGNGTNVLMAAISSGDIPNNAANTSGNAATATLASTVTTNASLTGDVTSSGNVTTLAKIQGTTIATPAGGSTAFLNATGAWSTPSGGSSYGYYGSDTPAQRGWKEWSYPLVGVPPTSDQFVTGSILGASFIAQTSAAVTKVGVVVQTAATTPTAGENLIGIYSVSGTTATQVALTGDLGTWTGTGFQSYAFGTGFTLVAGTTYIVLMLSVATTPVELRGYAYSTTNFVNAGLNQATSPPYYKYFTYSTSGSTALPSPSYTIASANMTSTSVLAPWYCLL